MFVDGERDFAREQKLCQHSLRFKLSTNLDRRLFTARDSLASGDSAKCTSSKVLLLLMMTESVDPLFHARRRIMDDQFWGAHIPASGLAGSGCSIKGLSCYRVTFLVERV